MSEQIPAQVEECLYNLAATGVRADIIRAYEEGKGRPTRSKYNKLAEFFGWEAWQ